MTAEPTISPMSPADLGRALAWAAAEGWNPGLDDAAPFLASDPEGFLVARVAGEPVGAISVVAHSPAHAFLGLFLVRPDWRGRGIGGALWTAGLARAGGRTVGLDGVPAQEARYARAGFVRDGATIRLEGVPEPVATAPGGRIRPAIPADRPVLLALDRAATGVDRPRFLAAWTAGAATRRTVVLEAEGRVRGFATARACGRGVKVGPVVAIGADAALALAGAAAAALAPPGTPAALDVPEANPAILGRLRAAGFSETFRTARMHRGRPPGGDGTQAAIATMELG